MRLALATRMLFRGDTAFINGELRSMGRSARTLTSLADRRELAPGRRLEPPAMPALYERDRAETSFSVTNEG